MPLSNYGSVNYFNFTLVVTPTPISFYLNSPHPRLLQQEKEYRRTYWDWYYIKAECRKLGMCKQLF